MTDTPVILFGADETSGIVAVEVGESEALIYVRKDGRVTETREQFRPWMLVTDADVPNQALVELKGNGYRRLVTFPDWSTFTSTRAVLRGEARDFLAYPSPEKQFLMSTGKTLFKGMTFDDVHRMQVDIETVGLSSEPESNRILLIAISDNRGFEQVLDGDEADMLTRLVSIIREIDPDVLEGHNIFGFDIPFLSARAKRRGVKLSLGRDGSEISFGSERNCPIGGYSRPFVPAFVHGRHVVDTLLSVQRYDIQKGILERHGLKECARIYGIAEPDRVVIPGERILEFWEKEPELLKKYALQDVRETRSLAALVCPPEFYLTQMVPDTYQSTATTGNGEKINSILVREYLRQGCAAPKSQPPRTVPGGYTKLYRAGLIRGVVKCDVESLYPSLMLSRHIKPATDTLDVFIPALVELTRRRIEAKWKAKSGPEGERTYWDGFQGAFKILINSFYGYLGAPFNFNDFDAAERITSDGQEIVKQIAESIESRGGRVIEIDTDGVYFEPPPGTTTPEAEETLVAEVGKSLPEGINLVHDGRYAAMLSLKVKNYVLVGYDGRKIFKGSSLRSRADEPFGREFISRAVDLLMQDDKQGVSLLYKDLAEQIRSGKLTVEQFARRERVTSKTFSSSQKKRLASAARDAVVGDYVTIYEKNNGGLGLVEDYAGDENRRHLLEKLHKFACRLREAFGDEFDALFPKPGVRNLSPQQAEAAGQVTFDF